MRERDHGHHGGMPGADYFRFVAQVMRDEYGWKYGVPARDSLATPETGNGVATRQSPVVETPAVGEGMLISGRGSERYIGEHHSGMPNTSYFEMVRDAEYAWNHRME